MVVDILVCIKRLASLRLRGEIAKKDTNESPKATYLFVILHLTTIFLARIIKRFEYTN